MDLHLKADDKETLMLALESAGLLEKIDGNYVPTFGVSFDEIGVIVKFDSETEESTTIPGWHVNLRTIALTEEQEELLIDYIVPEPKTPFRVWL